MRSPTFTYLHLSRVDQLRHLLTWVFVYAYLYITAPHSDYGLIQAIGCIFSILNFSILYYTLYFFLLPNVWPSRKVVLAPGVIVLFVFYVCLKLGNMAFLVRFAHLYSPPGRVLRAIRVSGLYFVPIGVLSFSAFFKRLALEKLRVEKQREQHVLVKELDYLKNQFNSHLTFNFLNFIYSKVVAKSKNAAEAIELFSEQLHYALQKDGNSPVSLTDELENITNFTKLQQCLCPELNFKLETPGEIRSVSIYPGILLSLIETTFQDGIRCNPNKPIRLHLSIQANELTVDLSYWQKDDHSVQSEATDLEDYLQLFYPGNYSWLETLEGDKRSILLTLLT
jgi:hypothetical protein